MWTNSIWPLSVWARSIWPKGEALPPGSIVRLAGGGGLRAQLSQKHGVTALVRLTAGGRALAAGAKGGISTVRLAAGGRTQALGGIKHGVSTVALSAGGRLQALATEQAIVRYLHCTTALWRAEHHSTVTLASDCPPEVVG